MTTPVELVVGRLEDHHLGPKLNGHGYVARCPAHDDRTPSLGVSEGADGRALVLCRAGCDTNRVLDALDLKPADLFDKASSVATEHSVVRPKMVATHDYVDESGRLLFQTVRFDPKDFRQRRPDGAGGWIWNLRDARRVLYRLPDVLQAIATGADVIVAEGEKDADRLHGLGYTATCNPMGAGKWRPEHTETLRGADVIVVADADGPGRAHARTIAHALDGVAASVRCAEPAAGKDVSDHLNAGLTVEQLTIVEGWDRGDDAEADSVTPPGGVDPSLVDLAAIEFGIPREEAHDKAVAIADRRDHERVTSIARRLVRDERLIRDADFDSIDVVRASDLRDRQRPTRRRILGDLLLDGHNATVVGRKKVGKSTYMENAVVAMVSGSDFLGRFPVPEPLRVAYLNYELDEEDMDARRARLKLSLAAEERWLILNLRGHRLPLMTDAGREWLAKTLVDHGTDVLVVDPFGAAYASAGGEKENDAGMVRQFTTALDETKRLAGIRSLLMAVHTGHAEHAEGEERARGSSVLEDWPDVLMYVTKDDQEQRYLRTDGRAPLKLNESRLGFDEYEGRLMLATTDIGLNRKKAKASAHVAAVVDAVKAAPGINTTDLRAAIHEHVKHNDDKASAITAALASGAVHYHDGQRSAHLHYEGPAHLDDESCRGG